ARLKLIFDSLQSGIIIIDPETRRIVDINPAAERLINQARDHIIGGICHKFICPVEANKCPVLDLGQTVDNSERILLTADGRKVPIIKTVIDFSIGNKKYLLENFIDITERKQLEEQLIINQELLQKQVKERTAEISKTSHALQESKSKYEVLFESANDAIFIINNNVFTDCNHRAEIIFGMPSEKIIGHSPVEFSPEFQPNGKLSSEAAMEKIEAAFAGNAQIFEWTHIHHDGSLFCTEVSLNRINTGNSWCIQAIVRDISERKLAEEQVNRIAKEWQVTFDTISDTICLMDKDRRILKCNAAMEKMFGKTAEEIIGRQCFEIVHGTSAPINDCPVARALQSKHRETIELVIGDRYYEVSVDPLLDQQGELTGAVHIIADITERKKTEIALAESEKQFHLLFKTVLVPLAVVDNNGAVKYLNDYFTRTFGYTQEYLPTKQDWLRLAFPDEKYRQQAVERWDAAYSLAQTSGSGSPAAEYNITCKDGSVRIVEISGVIIGENVVVSFVDITQSKQIEAGLQELNASKNKLFSVIGHDLKNSFHNTLGFSELLKDALEQGNTESLVEFADIINTSAQQTYNILESLLEWAKLQQGNISFKPESVILYKIVNEELDTSKESYLLKNITINNCIDEKIQVMADKNMLKMIIRNLLMNAIKFTRENGKIEFLALSKKDEVEISVVDNGIGMTAEEAKTLFNGNSNNSRHGTNNEPGTGLGLMLCHDFVSMHGGKIWVESEPDQGSCFKFTLPTHHKPVGEK
ncbi:MAG: PAS domain-containing sensor histidine kinase, partial [Victivallaceae bacterium]